MENNHHIDRIFKSGVERYELRPSDDVWNRIERELDQTKARTESRIPLYRYAAMVMVFISVALLSLPAGRQFTAFNPPANPVLPPAAAVSPAALTFTQIAAAVDQQPAIPQLITTTPRTTSNTKQVQMLTASAIEFPTPQEEFIFLPAMDEDEEYANNSALPAAARIFNTDEPIDMIAYSQIEDGIDDAPELFESPDFIARYRDLDMRGAYIGVTGGYNQVSLLEYSNVFNDTRPIQPSLKFGTTKGIKFGYNVTNNFGVEAEYVYNALQGQNYIMSEDDEIVEKSLSLNYDLIPVMVKAKVGRISTITDQPIVLNYSAGVQYGILREARMPQDKRYEESAEELFKANDVSLVLGLEYDIYLNDNIVLSAGARGAISTDISTHVEPLNDYAKRNFVFGLHGGLSYVFR